MTEYQAVSSVLALVSLIVAALALHFARQAQARAARAEGREVAAEVRGEQTHTLALDANERAKRAEARAEDAHQLVKERHDAERQAPVIFDQWMADIRVEIARLGPMPRFHLKKTLDTDAHRLAAARLKEKHEALGLDYVSISTTDVEIEGIGQDVKV